MSREVTVIADDLSGAADCAAAFARSGLVTVVSLEDEPSGVAAQVLAVDTRSRGESAEAARGRTGAAVHAAFRAGTRLVYKKIDSTLRGHVGPEVAAALTVAAAALAPARPIVVMAPAFPATGRLVRAGRLFVDGAAWDQVPGALLAAAGLAVASVGTTAGDVAALAREMERLAAEGAEAIVCDAASDADLGAIAEAGARLARPVVWVGSGGLARHLPHALGLGSPAMLAPVSDGSAISGPTLVLVGSRTEVAQRQAVELARQDGIATIAVAARTLLSGPGAAGWRDAAALIDGSLREGRDTCVVIAVEDDGERALDHALARALGRLTAVPAEVGGLVATGGDTARAALDARRVTRFRVTGEVEAGVPMGLTDGPRPLRLVTKAGGFGTPTTLTRCRASLRGAGTRSLSA